MIMSDLTYEGRHDELEVRQAVTLINMDLACQRYSCLPGPGGLLNQDSRIVTGLLLVADAFGRKEKREYDKQKNAS